MILVENVSVFQHKNLALLWLYYNDAAKCINIRTGLMLIRKGV